VTVPEISIHMSVTALLRHKGSTSWCWFHVPNGERADPLVAAKLRSMGPKPGDTLISPDGRLHFMELKRHGAKLTAEQDDFRMFCLRANVPFAVAYSEAAVALAQWGIIPPEPNSSGTFAA
jgi:hypothetical protein